MGSRAEWDLMISAREREAASGKWGEGAKRKNKIKRQAKHIDEMHAFRSRLCLGWRDLTQAWQLEVKSTPSSSFIWKRSHAIFDPGSKLVLRC